MTQYFTVDYNNDGTCSDCYSGYMQTTETADTYYNNYYNHIRTIETTGTYYNNYNSSCRYVDIIPSLTICNTSRIDNVYSIPHFQNRTVQERPSEQELLRQREERSKAEEVAKKALKDTLEAEEKARLLLLECLDHENKQRLLNRKPLEVSSRLFGDIKYQIPISNGRIKAWKEDKIVTELCLTVRESGCLPTDDVVLTKLLHVLHDEENMLRTANHFDIKENLLARLS